MKMLFNQKYVAILLTFVFAFSQTPVFAGGQEIEQMADGNFIPVVPALNDDEPVANNKGPADLDAAPTLRAATAPLRAGECRDGNMQNCARPNWGKAPLQDIPADLADKVKTILGSDKAQMQVVTPVCIAAPCKVPTTYTFVDESGAKLGTMVKKLGYNGDIQNGEVFETWNNCKESFEFHYVPKAIVLDKLANEFKDLVGDKQDQASSVLSDFITNMPDLVLLKTSSYRFLHNNMGSDTENREEYSWKEGNKTYSIIFSSTSRSGNLESKSVSWQVSETATQSEILDILDRGLRVGDRGMADELRAVMISPTAILKKVGNEPDFSYVISTKENPNTSYYLSPETITQPGSGDRVIWQLSKIEFLGELVDTGVKPSAEQLEILDILDHKNVAKTPELESAVRDGIASGAAIFKKIGDAPNYSYVITMQGNPNLSYELSLDSHTGAWELSKSSYMSGDEFLLFIDSIVDANKVSNWEKEQFKNVLPTAMLVEKISSVRGDVYLWFTSPDGKQAILNQVKESWGESYQLALTTFVSSNQMADLLGDKAKDFPLPQAGPQLDRRLALLYLKTFVKNLTNDNLDFVDKYGKDGFLFRHAGTVTTLISHVQSDKHIVISLSNGAGEWLYPRPEQTHQSLNLEDAKAVLQAALVASGVSTDQLQSQLESITNVMSAPVSADRTNNGIRYAWKDKGNANKTYVMTVTETMVNGQVRTQLTYEIQIYLPEGVVELTDKAEKALVKKILNGDAVYKKSVTSNLVCVRSPCVQHTTDTYFDSEGKPLGYRIYASEKNPTHTWYAVDGTVVKIIPPQVIKPVPPKPLPALSVQATAYKNAIASALSSMGLSSAKLTWSAEKTKTENGITMKYVNFSVTDASGNVILKIDVYVSSKISGNGTILQQTAQTIANQIKADLPKLGKNKHHVYAVIEQTSKSAKINRTTTKI